MHNANPVLLLGKAIWPSYRTFRGELPNFLPGRAPDFLGSCFMCQDPRSSGSHFSPVLRGSRRKA